MLCIQYNCVARKTFDGAKAIVLVEYGLEDPDRFRVKETPSELLKIFDKAAVFRVSEEIVRKPNIVRVAYEHLKCAVCHPK